MRPDMRTARQALFGLIIALVSGGIFFGIVSLSLVEGRMGTSQTATPTFFTPTSQLITMPAETTSAPSPSPTPTYTSLPSPTLTKCPPPPGWTLYIVQPGDTLALLANRYQLTQVQILSANCLGNAGIFPGNAIYLPPLPTATRFPYPTLVPCGPPRDWVIYIVIQGDTLYRLSLAYNVTVPQLQKANCLGGSDLIRVGQALYVPPWAPQFPTPTPWWWFTDTPYETPLPSATPVPPTDTPATLGPT